MYKTINDFLNDWTKESASTYKVLSNITDDSLETKVYPEGRTLGFLSWHIVTTIGEMLSRTGLKVKCPDENSREPNNAKEIFENYKKSSDSLITEIKNNWTDKTLEEEVDMYGESWKKGFILKSLVNHQIHHRGQITMLMRHAGLRVPGVYGPSREEWQQMGREPAK